MKRNFTYCLLTLLMLTAAAGNARGLHKMLGPQLPAYCCDTIACDTFTYKTAAEILAEMQLPPSNPYEANFLFNPKVFNGYRHLYKKIDFTQLPPYTLPTPELPCVLEADSLFSEGETQDANLLIEEGIDTSSLTQLPSWLVTGRRMHRLQADLQYQYMLSHPYEIEYAQWDLPAPVTLYEEDLSFLKFIKRQEIPDELTADTQVMDLEVPKKHWLHKFNTALQFSQAFISPNWYQGGNDYLSLLFNFNWNVQLNQTFHPKLLFQSDLQYKLALSSTPKGSIRKYQISDDAFQYNLNMGLKAIGKWYYSFNMLFKTQLFTNYEEDSWQRTASFLSPSELNTGLGMSYNRVNKHKTFQYTLTISPLSYNLKTCIAPNSKIPHELFNIDPDKKTKSEFGSNAEFNMTWNLTANISYKTRMFLFTDYHYFLSDWQNTFSFDINRFLSTQLFLHLRWDTSSESSGRWKKFMMREILSFGLSYTFSTK